MVLALHPVDYAVFTLFIGVIIATGFAVTQPARNVAAFLQAERRLSIWPTGLSLAATLVPAVGVTGSAFVGLGMINLPGQAYVAGVSLILIPLGMWLTVPVVWRYVLPLYQGLELTSIYEYLELRFDRRTSSLAAIVFLAWRITWITGVLAMGSHLLVLATGLPISPWILIILIGAVTTGYTCVGGIKAVIWAENIHLLVMGVAMLLVIGGIWISLDGGPSRVWEVARALERNRVVPAGGAGTYWLSAGLVLQASLTLLMFFVADQATLQRLLALSDLTAARRAYLVGCNSLTIAVLLMMMTGLGLLAFYHDHADALRAKWVSNVDPSTRQHWERIEGAGPPLDWDDAATHVDSKNIQVLVDSRRLIRPNRQVAIESTDGLLDAEALEGVRVAGLLTRYPPPANLRRGEVVLHARAADELLPWYVVTQLPWGLTGLAIAAILAAIMSSVDAGLLAACGIVVTHLAGSREESSVETHPTRLPPRMVVVSLGLAVTLGAVGMVTAVPFFRALLVAICALGGPLLAIFLLGIVTRRTNGVGARTGLVLGVLLTICLAYAESLSSDRLGWPDPGRLPPIGAAALGTVLTLVIGYGVSLCLGGRRTKEELRGLVCWHGPLGKRNAEVLPQIKLPTEKRWK